MANMFNRGLSFFGLAEPQEFEDDELETAPSEEPNDVEYDREEPVNVQPSRLSVSSRGSAASGSNTNFPKSVMNRITTIHPRNYNEVESVGRALREGTPVVLNLTGVSDKDAQRIVDFATGVVFGVRGSVERVTPSVLLLSPAAVSIRPEQPNQSSSTVGIFD
ncbi:cell division protein SepF [Alloscardovia criceti]|uniref:cell division protein SepF n=1 Tax=Alloscardovia criceti TaxID=356828 RepID=UPI0003634C57|nr:cell division protein SepF [Alloscardovia criceti]